MCLAQEIFISLWKAAALGRLVASGWRRERCNGGPVRGGGGDGEYKAAGAGTGSPGGVEGKGGWFPGPGAFVRGHGRSPGPAAPQRAEKAGGGGLFVPENRSEPAGTGRTRRAAPGRGRLKPGGFSSYKPPFLREKKRNHNL